MDLDDDFWRLTILIAFLGATVAYLLGGFLTQVAGLWRDGDRQVTLRQFGPWVWGEAVWPDGRQTYRGRAIWNRVRLLRSDHGVKHLSSLGFQPQQLPALEGKATGHLALRLRDGALVGQFFGRKFSFDEGEIRSVSVVPPVERIWKRP